MDKGENRRGIKRMVVVSARMEIKGPGIVMLASTKTHILDRYRISNNRYVEKCKPSSHLRESNSEGNARNQHCTPKLIPELQRTTRGGRHPFSQGLAIRSRSSACDSGPQARVLCSEQNGMEYNRI
ncbi:hypothetical protein KQX54_006246 [Cotesia glomerata]|uniref:Uncharacterized protein n=1 Tax=Cotesia glomerata TaxID=32391 RepID=A0AAV7I5I2_COTGL|nr:hypothetical protein KQX54_006246 [Cotesia glomerata]